MGALKFIIFIPSALQCIFEIFEFSFEINQYTYIKTTKIKWLALKF